MQQLDQASLLVRKHVCLRAYLTSWSGAVTSFNVWIGHFSWSTQLHMHVHVLAGCTKRTDLRIEDCMQWFVLQRFGIAW